MLRPIATWGLPCRRKRELEAAIDSYKQALKIKPDSILRPITIWEIALKEKGELEAAIDSYKQAHQDQA